MRDSIQGFRAAMLAALGHAPDTVEPGKLQRFATCDRRGDLAGWCKLFDDLRGGVFGCHRQSISETWSARDRSQMTAADRAAMAREFARATAARDAQRRRQWSENGKRVHALWSECTPIVAGSPVAVYLQRRGLDGLWPLPPCLRLHGGMDYWEGGNRLGRFPAMVASLVTPDGKIVALHRTYLTVDGRKAAVPTPKKLTPACGSLVGACIPLHESSSGQNPTPQTMGIAEGIETALSAGAGSRLPTAAAYSAGSLAAWRWPQGLRRLVIFADADKAGRRAAVALRARALAAGLYVDVLTPASEGTDWCDVWAQRGLVLAEAGGVS